VPFVEWHVQPLRSRPSAPPPGMAVENVCDRGQSDTCIDAAPFLPSQNLTIQKYFPASLRSGAIISVLFWQWWTSPSQTEASKFCQNRLVGHHRAIARPSNYRPSLTPTMPLPLGRSGRFWAGGVLRLSGSKGAGCQCPSHGKGYLLCSGIPPLCILLNL